MLNDYYTCELYPKNRDLFSQVIPGTTINFPSEFSYGLVANKWLFKTFKGKVGLIGGGEKMDLIKELMQHEQYQEYLGLDKFNDYIKIPQKFACDDLDATEKMVGEQLENSTSDKSGLLPRLKKYKKSIYLDVGGGIDAISGVVISCRPYMGDWVNYQIKNKKLNDIDFLGYNLGEGQHVYLK